MSFVPINPRPMLQDLYALAPLLPAPAPTATDRPLRRASMANTPDTDSNNNNNRVNKDVYVRLKWGETEYKGRLVSIDSYMNIQLSGAQEYIDQKLAGDLGQILIRCNNVLWVRGADGDTNMDD
ncbi:hypothetical protein RB594_007836 [Gaeumannomyces avenae]